MRPLEEAAVQKLGEQYFDKWTLHLAVGFNVLVSGAVCEIDKVS